MRLISCLGPKVTQERPCFLARRIVKSKSVQSR
jgi:hypothetical protein